jgi:hypothetical protein
MKKNEVKVGGLYHAKVSDKLVTVRIDSTHNVGGWSATNTRTGKRIRIKSAQRLRGAVTGAAKAGAPAVSEATRAAGEGNTVADDDKAKAPGKKDAAMSATASGTDTKAPVKVASRKAVAAKGKAAVATATKSAKAKRTKATDGKAKPKRLSALDAAVQILAKAGKPMRAHELITAMAEQDLWKSPGGATPHATLYAAMAREQRDKGSASRFTKVDRGLFAFNKAGA